jgi:PAS domain S-box-containing protein
VSWSANRRLLSEHPWELTELGPAEHWPAEMRAVVETVLSSAFPICTVWGQAALQIYNDGYNEIYGTKHPASFGAPATQSWAEIWEFLGPALQQVRAMREPLWFKGALMPIARNGRPEECYFDFSYSPIKDLRGNVLGIMSVAAERTAETVRQRRGELDKLLELPGDASLPELSAAVRALLEHNEVDARLAFWHPAPDSAGSGWTLRCEDAFDAQLGDVLATPLAGAVAFPVPSTLADDGCACYGHLIPVASAEGRSLATLAVIPGELVTQPSHHEFCEQLFGRIQAEVRRAETQRELVDKLRDDFAERDAFYRFLFENMQDAAFYTAIAANEEVVLAANRQASALLGYAPAELVGKRREELFFAGDPLLQGAVAARQRRQHFVAELTARRRDGVAVPVEISSSLVQLRAGTLRAVSIARDTSDRIARERDKAERARFEAMVELTGGIAHDFNNFLTVILGNLDALQEVLPVGSPEQALARDGLLGAEAAAALTQQLLTFAKRQPLRPVPLAIPRFLKEIQGLLASTLGETNELVLCTADDLPCCELDTSQLTSALLNLVANARHAMPAGGTVTVRVATRHISVPSLRRDGYELAPGQYVVIDVADTGVGIPEALQDRIFEPFFTTRAGDSGSGLGLATVQGFARQSGGDVRVFSVPGQGSRFELLFPVAQMATPHVAPEQARAVPGGTVLVVEDNAGARQNICEGLRLSGFDVLQAPDADGGLRLLRQARVDYLLANLALPDGWNGVDLAQAARRIRPDLAVVLTTGGARGDLAGHVAASGWPILTKPFTARDLTRVLLASQTGQRTPAG